MGRRSRVVRFLLVASVTGSVSACLTSPKAEAARQQQMIEMSDAINDLRMATSELTTTLDSLKTIMAKQDTTLARVANVTGVVVLK